MKRMARSPPGSCIDYGQDHGRRFMSLAAAKSSALGAVLLSFGPAPTGLGAKYQLSLRTGEVALSAIYL